MAKTKPIMRELNYLLDARPGEQTIFSYMKEECRLRQQVEFDPAVLGFLFGVEFVLDWLWGGRRCPPLVWLDEAREKGHLISSLTSKPYESPGDRG